MSTNAQQQVVRLFCQPVINQTWLSGQQHPQQQQPQPPRLSLPLALHSGRTPTPSSKEVHSFVPLTPSSEVRAPLTPALETRPTPTQSGTSPKIPCLLVGGVGGLQKRFVQQQSPRPVGSFSARSNSQRQLELDPKNLTPTSSGGSPFKAGQFSWSPRTPADAVPSQLSPPPSPSRAKSPTPSSPSPQRIRSATLRTIGSCTKLQLDPEATIARVIDLLAHRESLKAEVVKSFKRVAGTATNINIRGLQNFKVYLTQAIGVPLEALGNLQTEYIRFDFDGDGRLHFNEAYKLVKHHLWMYLKKQGGVSQVDVPWKSLEQAGYQVAQELGRGSQGVAMLATDLQGQEWCVKCYEKGKMSCGGLSELKDEFETMQRLSCGMIAHALEIFQDQDYYYTIGEAYHGGDLTTLRERADKEGVDMNEQWWRSVFRQCFQALAFMHENAMMHCDIKEPNIMVKKNNFQAPEIVLIDFGVSKAMAEEDNGKAYGTPGYIPPETFEMKMWFPGGDVFSMGVCILQVIGDQVPSSSLGHSSRGIFVEGCSSLKDVMQATLVREPPFHLIPKSMPGLETAVRGMLQKQMALRPRAPQVLQDPWFCADLDPCTLRACEYVLPDHMLGTMGISEDLYQAF